MLEPETLPSTPTAEAQPTDVPVGPGGSDPQVEAPPTGPLILGTDKRNPVFAVDEDESGERLLGYYGFELMEIVNNEPWEATQVMGKTTITRCRNSSSDLRLYHFEYFERPWEKNPKLRQIVVQATDDRGRTIQVAILTDDFQRAATEIIELMFKRWLQENDFKDLDKHFGINQITSYRSIEYAQLKGQVEDRQIKSVARKALNGQLKQVPSR